MQAERFRLSARPSGRLERPNCKTPEFLDRLTRRFYYQVAASARQCEGVAEGWGCAAKVGPLTCARLTA